MKEGVEFGFYILVIAGALAMAYLGVSFTGYVVEDSDLILYYNFEGNFNDLSGGGNDGISRGVAFTEGKFGQAGSFSEGSYIIVPSSDALNLGEDYSISLWINPDSTSIPLQTFLERGINPFQRTSFSLKWEEVQIDEKTSWATSSLDISPGVWSHLVIVHNGKENLDRVYVNADKTRGMIGRTSDPSNEGDLYIGRDVTFNGNNSYSGKIDDLRFYDEALTIDEVREIYGLDLTPVKDEIVSEPEELPLPEEEVSSEEGFLAWLKKVFG